MDMSSTPPNGESPAGPPSDVVPLTRSECLQRLGAADIGRIVFTEAALPVAKLACYALDGKTVVTRISSHETTKFVESKVVAFQADNIDPRTGAGWTVTVVGRARLITDPLECTKIDEHGIRTWAPSIHDQFVRIEATIVDGRLLPNATTIPIT